MRPSKHRLRPAAALGLAAAAVLALAKPAPAAEQAKIYSLAQFERWQTELSNWGRWGKDDQLGTLNLITQAKRAQAMALARKGIVVSMQKKSVMITATGTQATTNEPQGVTFYESRFRTVPTDDPQHHGGASGEVQRLNPHGDYTHVDALCHYDDTKGRLFNGIDRESTVSKAKGCSKLGLDTWPNGAIVTRGIVVDMPRLKARHTPGAPVTVADLEAWEKQTGVRVSSGDALFVRNPGPVVNGQPTVGGFDLSVLPWMKARGVSLTSGFYKTTQTPFGSQVAEVFSTDHRLVLAAMGLPLLDNPYLDAVCDEAARQKQWAFMLVVAPHVIPGGTGQMVNPLAMF